jgi:hypothetical protein
LLKFLAVPVCCRALSLNRSSTRWRWRRGRRKCFKGSQDCPEHVLGVRICVLDHDMFGALTIPHQLNTASELPPVLFPLLKDFSQLSFCMPAVTVVIVCCRKPLKRLLICFDEPRRVV